MEQWNIQMWRDGVVRRTVRNQSLQVSNSIYRTRQCTKCSIRRQDRDYNCTVLNKSNDIFFIFLHIYFHINFRIQNFKNYFVLEYEMSFNLTALKSKIPDVTEKRKIGQICTSHQRSNDCVDVSSARKRVRDSGGFIFTVGVLDYPDEFVKSISSFAIVWVLFVCAVSVCRVEMRRVCWMVLRWLFLPYLLLKQQRICQMCPMCLTRPNSPSPP